MKHIQKTLEEFQKEREWEINDKSALEARESLLLNHMLLTTEVAEIAEELRRMFNIAYHLTEDGEGVEDAFRHAKNEVKEDIGKEIADCIAYLSKFATYFERDMEEDVLNKLQEIKQRQKPNLQKRMKEEVR